MIFSKTVKLNSKDLDIVAYLPPQGINVSWKKYHDELYATFMCGNVNQPKYVRDKHDINEALAKLKVIQDTIKDWHTYKDVVPQGPKLIVTHDNGNRVITDKG